MLCVSSIGIEKHVILKVLTMLRCVLNSGVKISFAPGKIEVWRYSLGMTLPHRVRTLSSYGSVESKR